MGFWDWLRPQGREARSAASLLDLPAPRVAPVSPPPTRPSRAASSGFAVIDVETTGLSPASHRVLELAIVLCDPTGRPEDEWMTRFNPQGPVGATHIHGISEVDVLDAPFFGHLVPDVTDRLRGRAIVAHNARFDMAFLRTEYARAGWRMPWLPSLCTLDASRRLLPDLPRRRLPDCCNATGVSHSGAHSALGDARAAAALLRWYMDRERHPSSPWAVAVHDAAGIVWPTERSAAGADPSAGGGGTKGARPPRTTAAVRKAPRTRLTALLDDFPLRAALRTGAHEGATAYLELVAEALEDGVLEDAEREALAQLAALYDLDEEARAEVHRAFVRALAVKAAEDGRVVAGEWGELTEVGALLGLGRHDLDEAVRDAKESRLRVLAGALRPLPADWEHGEPLRLDDAVVFTGCEGLGRAALERAAERAGLRVMTSVSRKTALLVSDGSVAGTKAADARRLGTRVVDPALFAVLVEHLQPPLRESTGTVARAVAARVAVQAVPATPASATTSVGTPPAVVRRWARENGFELSDRGRLPLDVLEAYAAFQADQGRPAEAASSS